MTIPVYMTRILFASWTLNSYDMAHTKQLSDFIVSYGNSFGTWQSFASFDIYNGDDDRRMAQFEMSLLTIELHMQIGII